MGGRRRGRGLFFILASSFPALVPPAAAGRARGRPAAPAWFPARAPGPAGLALPRSPRRLGPKHRRRPAAGPGRALAPRGGPAAQPGSSCGPRAAAPKRREARWHSLLAESARARRGSRPPTGQDAGSCGGCAGRGGGGRLEGAKMALGLALRQCWWRSCSAGAIFPGGTGSALLGRFAGPSAGRSGTWGPRSAGRSLYVGLEWSSLFPPGAPRPKRVGCRLRAGRGWGLRCLVPFTTCL